MRSRHEDCHTLTVAGLQLCLVECFAKSVASLFAKHSAKYVNRTDLSDPCSAHLGASCFGDFLVAVSMLPRTGARARPAMPAWQSSFVRRDGKDHGKRDQAGPSGAKRGQAGAKRARRYRMTDHGRILYFLLAVGRTNYEAQPVPVESPVRR